MDKKKYYVSVQAGTVLDNQSDASYELEIEATSEEIAKLEEIFEEMDDLDEASGIQGATMLSFSYPDNKTNEGYDYYLKEAYAMIHDLGSEATKEHIRNMNILT